jgi:hypothetical protein
MQLFPCDTPRLLKATNYNGLKANLPAAVRVPHRKIGAFLPGLSAQS